MDRNKKGWIAKFLSLVVLISGILVVAGWIFNIGSLKAITSTWVSMKFDTAIAFIASSVSLFFIARAREGELDTAQVVLSITTLIIMLLMGVLFFSTLLGIHTGAEDLFIKETQISAKTVVPGRPSLPTMFNFILISLAGIFVMADIDKVWEKLRIIGLIVAAIGALAVIGYIVHLPWLYYFVEGINSAMAFNTAALFILIGIGILCLSD